MAIIQPRFKPSSGRDSHWAVVPNAFRVNANSFQTNLRRGPGHKAVNRGWTS